MNDNDIISNTQLSISITRVEEKLVSLTDDVRHLEKTIESFINSVNGRDGLIERITVAEQRLGAITISDPEKGSSSIINKAFFSIIGICTGLLALLTSLLRK